MPGVWIGRLKSGLSELQSPEGEVKECATGGLAIELRRKYASENQGRLDVYDSAGRLQATENFQVH